MGAGARAKSAVGDVADLLTLPSGVWYGPRRFEALHFTTERSV